MKQRTTRLVEDGNAWNSILGLDQEYGGTLFADVNNTFRELRDEKAERRRLWDDRIRSVPA